MSFEAELESNKEKKKYIVTKPGVRIQWMESTARYVWSPKTIVVPVGSIIYYEGGGFGIGSDPGWEEYYSYAGNKGELYGSRDAIRQLSENEWMIYLKSKYGMPVITKKKYPDCSANEVTKINIIEYLALFLKLETQVDYPIESIIGKASFVYKKADIHVQLYDLGNKFDLQVIMKPDGQEKYRTTRYTVKSNYARIKLVLNKLCFEQGTRYKRLKK